MLTFNFFQTIRYDDIPREFEFRRQIKYFDSYPFREGDIVTIKDAGLIYPTYSHAFHYFGIDYPCYYSISNIPKNKEFKIYKIAVHETMDTILAHIRDRDFRDIVIGINGLKLIKQFPLRKDETTNVEIERIH